MYGANRDPTFYLLSRNVVLRAVGKESRDAGMVVFACSCN